MHDSNEARRRINQYQHIDGATELVFGTAHLLIAAFIFMSILDFNVNALAYALSFVITGLFLALLAFKQRVTLPRTGVVAPRRPSSPTVGLFVLSLVVVVYKPMRVVEAAHLSYPFIWAALLAVTLVLVGQGLRRFYVFATLALFVGVLATWAGLAENPGAGVVSLVTGAALIVSGGVVLRRYLKAKPGESA